MLKKLLSKKSITPKEFLDELSQNIFNEIKINQLYEDNDIDLNWTNEDNETMLHYCSKKGFAQAVRWLLNNGANIEAENNQGETPIFYSIYSKDREIINILLEYNANVNHINSFKRTLLQEAIITASNKFIKLLMQKVKDVNNCDIHGNNLIFDAIANGSPEIITEVAKLDGININQINKEGNTILHKELILKNHELAMQLLELGADPTIQDKKGKNFLFYAVSKGDKNIPLLNKAVEMGCNINSRSSDDTTILMESISHYLKVPEDNKELRMSHLNMIKTLIRLGVNVTAVDTQNENVLFNVTRNLDKKLILLLLDSDSFNINHQNIYGETIFFELVLKGGVNHLDLIKLYLEKGANPNIKNKNGKTIIEILIDLTLHYENNKPIDLELEKKINRNGEYPTVLAFILNNSTVDLDQYTSKFEPLFFESIIYYNFKLFKLLKKFDLDINQKDKDGNNILFRLMDTKNAIDKDELKLFLNTLQSLINIGVNVYTKNKNGESILHKAIAEKDEYTFKLLLTCKTDILAQDNFGRTIMHVSVLKKKVLNILN